VRRRRLLVALGLGAGGWLAVQAVGGLAGAWLLEGYFTRELAGLPLALAAGSAGAVLLAGAALGALFRRLAGRTLGRDQQFIPLPEVRIVQRLRAPSPRPPVLAAGMVLALGALAAALAWCLAASWAAGGPPAGWAALPPSGAAAAHLAGLAGLGGVGLAAPLVPFVTWAVYRRTAPAE
jgi:hypothetical protein